MTREEEIRARCEAATPGEWTAGRGDMATIVDGNESKWIYAGDKYLAISSGYEIPEWEQVMANARFIAHARADIPYLLDENARLRADNEVLRNSGHFDPLEMAKIAVAVQERDGLRAELEAAVSDMEALADREADPCDFCDSKGTCHRPDSCPRAGYRNFKWRGS